MRQLPLASDRDRLAAARYATEKLLQAMRRGGKGWGHLRRTDAAIVSRRSHLAK